MTPPSPAVLGQALKVIVAAALLASCARPLTVYNEGGFRFDQARSEGIGWRVTGIVTKTSGDNSDVGTVRCRWYDQNGIIVGTDQTDVFDLPVSQSHAFSVDFVRMLGNPASVDCRVSNR